MSATARPHSLSLPQRLWRSPGEPAVILIIFLLVLAFSGGASRADAPSQMIVRVAAILLGGYSAFRLTSGQLRPYWPVLALLGAWTLLMLVQLIPLPPGIWTALPGRAPFVPLAELAQFTQPWRPISLAPDATLNSVMSMTVPIAGVLAFARLRPEDWEPLLLAIIILVCVSALWGILQISSGVDLLYLYRITNEGAAVGVFANRNHQALLLAVALPVLATYALLGRHGRGAGAKSMRGLIMLMVALVLFPLILITGSRAGLVLMLVGAMISWFLIALSRSGPRRAKVVPVRTSRRRGWQKGYEPGTWIVIVAVAAVLGATVLLTRAEAVQRLFSQDLAQEARFRLFGTFIEMVKTYFPVGTGFGTFDRVFRMHEPLSNLSFTYLNHVHNDLLEILIEGGVAAAVIAVVALGWIGWRGLSVWGRARDPMRRAPMLARLGSAMLVMGALASLGDYPLRTPIFGALMAIAMAFLCLRPEPMRSSGMDQEPERGAAAGGNSVFLAVN